MSALHRLLTIALALGLAACGTVREVPKIVEVPGPTVYVEIPKQMVAHCAIEEPDNASPLEAARVAKERKFALQECNRKLDAIDAVQGTEVPKK